MSLLTSTASGKRPLAVDLVEEEEEHEEGLQQKCKVQKLMMNSGSSSLSDHQNKPPVVTSKTSAIPVKVKYKLPDVPLADKYKGGEFFFVRECYAEYYLKVEALLVEEKEDCVTVTGTPGIGKSFFYAFFFDRFRKTHPDWTIIASTYSKDSKIKKMTVFEPGKQPDVYAKATQIELDEILLRLDMDQMKARQSKPEAEEKLLWLCDGPPEVDRGQTVVFTSPNEWLRMAKNNGQTYYMPPWTLEELQLAAFVLEYPLSDDEIESRFWNFGGMARNCFVLGPERIRHEIKRLTEPIEAITCREEFHKLLVGSRKDFRRNHFLHYEPKGDGRLWDTRIVSAMVRENLAERLFSVIKGRMNQVQTVLLGVPDADALRRSIFEVHAHTTLQRGRTLVARFLDVPNEQRMRFKIQKSAEIDIFQSNEVIAALLNNGPYHMPKEKSYLASIDGFYFPTLPVGEAPSMDEKDKRILLFQIITESRDDPVSASGIIYLLKKLGLLDLVKVNPKHAALIFFHPAVGSKDFKRQQILSSDTSPQDIGEIPDIGPGTVKTLATYNVKTIADLEAKIDEFQNGKIAVKDEKDRENWARAVRYWEQEVQYFKAPANIKMVNKIPRYVVS